MKRNHKMKITKSRLREIILEELQGETGIQENDSDDIFADNHYCIHHGGVEHNGRVQMAEAVQHVVPDESGYISHYDMRLIKSGIILEDVAAEDIQVTNASLAEAHHGARDDDEGEEGHAKMKPKKKPKKKDPKDKEGKRTPLSQKAQKDRRTRARTGLEEVEETQAEKEAKRAKELRDKRRKDRRPGTPGPMEEEDASLEELKALIAQELKNLL